MSGTIHDRLQVMGAARSRRRCVQQVRLLEQDEAPEGEIQAALARIWATFLADGMVGEQLEEGMRHEQEYLRGGSRPG